MFDIHLSCSSEYDPKIKWALKSLTYLLTYLPACLPSVANENRLHRKSAHRLVLLKTVVLMVK